VADPEPEEALAGPVSSRQLWMGSSSGSHGWARSSFGQVAQPPPLLPPPVRRIRGGARKRWRSGRSPDLLRALSLRPPRAAAPPPLPLRDARWSHSSNALQERGHPFLLRLTLRRQIACSLCVLCWRQFGHAQCRCMMHFSICLSLLGSA
jgi:hypothetical protein